MNEKRKDLTGGIILIAIGLLFLLGQLINLENWGLLLLPGLGALFLLWGIITRQSGLLIPGGILSGIGWGTYAIAGPWSLGQGLDDGGLFLIIFGAGFASITLFSAIFTKENHWWALIPGGIIAAVGASILFGGVFLDALEFVGRYWPIALILVGLYIIVQANREKTPKEKFGE